MNKLINIIIGLTAVVLVGAVGVLVYYYLQPTSQASKKLERDLEIWQKQANEKPDDPVNWANLGAVYLDMGDTQAAIENLSTAVSLDPEGYTYFNKLGQAYKQAGDNEAALENLKKASELYPQGEKFSPLYLVAEIYFETGDMEQARQYLQQSMDDNNTIWNSHYLLGQIFEQEGNLAKAKEEYEAAAMFRPESDELQEALSRVSG